MTLFSRLDHHERLMTRLAGRNGVDLELALQSGRVTPADYRAAVLSCVSCASPEACESRLDRGVAGVPDYCRNAGLVTRLAAAMSPAD